MEYYRVAARRRTVREFRTEAVPPEAVRRALAAGLQAPCNAHLKSWQFILLQSPEQRRRAVIEGLKARDMKDPAEIERFVARFADEELKSVYRRSLPLQLSMMLAAPEVLVVCFNRLAECRTLFELNPLASAWMCIENVMLGLAAEGLFGCTYTPYQGQGLKDCLGVPAAYEIAAVIPFGYPVEEPEPMVPEDLDARLHVDRWGAEGRPDGDGATAPPS